MGDDIPSTRKKRKQSSEEQGASSGVSAGRHSSKGENVLFGWVGVDISTFRHSFDSAATNLPWQLRLFRHLALTCCCYVFELAMPQTLAEAAIVIPVSNVAAE